MSFVDLKKQFIFYASYHNNPVNVAIHLFCIWQLLWSGLAIMQYTPALMETPTFITSISPLFKNVSINIALLQSLIYMVAYPLMDPIAGTIGSAMVLVLYLLTGVLVQSTVTVAGYSLLQVLIVFHVTMWIAQFIGHGVFEGRAPALLDSWDQAFLTAPLFVLLEVMFFLGYRKEFYKECMVQVDKNVKEFKKTKAS